MKILYISSMGGIHDYRFLEKLAADYEVLFIHYSRRPLYPEIRYIPRLKMIFKKPLFGSNPVFSHYLHFRNIIADFKPDLIHSGYVWQVGILPALIDFHPHLSMVWGSDVLIEPDKNPLIKYSVKKVLHQCDQIQCDADYVKHRMMNDFQIDENKITVFPWGIDLDKFHSLDKTACRKKINIGKDDFAVIFTRWLDPIYDIFTMLEGFKNFAKNKNDVKLIIATDGSQRDQLINYVRKEDLTNKVIFNGMTKYSEMPVYFNAANVYLSTSLSDGTSLSLLEAMSCGLGVIVTDLPANHEWIDSSNGFIIPKHSHEMVTAKLEDYYSDRNLLNVHGAINIKIAHKKADWNKNYLILKDIYSKMMSNGR